MGQKDYEHRIFQVTKLPDPGTVDPAEYHYLGEWDLSHAPEAMDAVINRRLGLVASLSLMAEPLERHARNLIEDEKFLTFEEYRRTVKRVQELSRTLNRITFNPDSYQAHFPPSSLETTFVRGYDPNRHTPDRLGYMAYLSEAAPELHRFF